MNLKLAMRWMMMAVAGVLLSGTGVAQQPPPADKPQQEAQVTTKQEPAASATKPEQKDPAAKAESEAAAPGKSQPGEPIIQSRKDKISYAFGVDLARDLQRQKDGVNVDLLVRALVDALAGNKLIMTDDEVATTVKAFESEQKQDLQHAKMMISERNKREGEAFFAENAKKDGVTTLPSGLQYKVLKKGDGKKPALEDVVLCNYTGRLLDGTEIDSSYKRNEPTKVPVRAVIPGWTQALQIMPVGSKWEIYVPPQLAYGDKSGGPIPPYATLIFDVELLSIQEKEKPQASAAPQSKPAPETKLAAQAKPAPKS
jgi:FKBP-type peptidyl-prolyl cis-trans isomerase